MAYNDKTPLQKAEYANETKNQLVTGLKNKGFDIQNNNSFREIAGIVTNNTTIVDTSDADATAGDIISTKTAYINGNKVTGTAIELKGQTKTVTPTTSQQSITPDTNYNGMTQVTVNAVDNTIDSNIIAGNIKNGVSILGITGTYETDISEEEALAKEILGKEAQ